MTHDQAADVRADIAYLKDLAAEGRSAPILVGPVLVAAALCFGAATAVKWAAALGVIPITGWGIMALWLGAGAIFAGILYALIRKMAASPGSSTRDNMIVAGAWSACGYFIFGIWLVLMAYALGTGSWAPMALMPAVVAVAYGTAWVVTGQLVSKVWMMLTGVASYAGAMALGWLANTDWTHAVYLVLLVVVALLPGLYLMRQAGRGAR